MGWFWDRLLLWVICIVGRLGDFFYCAKTVFYFNVKCTWSCAVYYLSFRQNILNFFYLLLIFFSYDKVAFSTFLSMNFYNNSFLFFNIELFSFIDSSIFFYFVVNVTMLFDLAVCSKFELNWKVFGMSYYEHA